MAPPTTTTTSAEKKSLGRRKIEIKQLVHEGHKQVTFSKRRVGIFKKAAELAVLCDAQIAVVTFSPGDKCFCFGHPSVDAVADRFASAAGRRDGAPAALPADFPDLNREHAEASAVLEAEKRREAELSAAGGGGGEYWWERAAGAMEAEELEIFAAALQEMKFNVERRIESMGNKSAADSGDREGGFGGDWEESGGGVFCNGFEPFWVNNGQPNNN